MKAPLAFLSLCVPHSCLLLPSPHFHTCPTFPYCSLDPLSGRWVSLLPSSPVTAPILAKHISANPCWYDTGYCEVTAAITLETQRSLTAEGCHSACAATAACEYFTFLHHRGSATCSLLSACDTFTQCPSNDKCISGPKLCSCPALGSYNPPEDGSTLYARWRCGDLDPYTSSVPAGTVCTVSCAAWKEGTFRSQCLRGGVWSASTPSITSASRLAQPHTDMAQPGQRDVLCGCQDVGPFHYDPNDEEFAELVCRGGGKDFKAEGGWSLTTTDRCDLWCSHVPVVSVFCQDSQWQGEPDRGFWCYTQPEHPEPGQEPLWRKIFSHDTSGGLFSNREDALRKNPGDPSALLFSILSSVSEMRRDDGTFHLKLCYPNIASPNCNEWLQTSNPVTESAITGFQPVTIAFPQNSVGANFGGLGVNAEGMDADAFMDDSPNHGRWWSAVGAYRNQGGSNSIPGPLGSTVASVELYIQYRAN